MLVLYGLYSLFAGGDKKKKKKVAQPAPPPQVVTPRKKRKARRNQPEETTEPEVGKTTYRKMTKSPEQLKREIEERMRNLQENARRKAQRSQDYTQEEPVLEQVYEEELATDFVPEKYEDRKYFNYDHQKIERSNLDDSPKTHKEDAHFAARDRKNTGVVIGKNFKFNAKHAVIYKEIMDRKYF